MSTSESRPSESAPRILIGTTPLASNHRPPAGAFVEIDGEPFYRIGNVDRMEPFFVSVVSDSDHWLFVSSAGGMSAGRGSPEHALFPYTTVDKIHDSQDQTGGKTILRVASGDGAEHLWEPFSDRYAGLYAIRRSLAKSLHGDVLRFEETNDDLGLTCAVTWSTSERFGFVKSTSVTNHGDASASVHVLDGIQNVMPHGITRDLQESRSVLGDAYKRNERVEGTTLGIFALSATPVDRAEPSEALLATTVWSAGLEPDALLLSSNQLDAFRTGRPLAPEALVKAQRGAYFLAGTLDLEPGGTAGWDIVADIEQDAADAVALADALTHPESLRDKLHADIRAGSARLVDLIAGADGEQATGEALTSARHRMNVLFNIMRGGAFDEGYSIVSDDLRGFIAHHNGPLAAANVDFFDSLPDRLSRQRLMELARARGPQIERLCSAYLPLSFSRRHGDPSRPWNHFSIDNRDADGSVVRGYEGNWRDIFQNWEALGRSYPGYLGGMIATFVGASTADGYNPYRITNEGIDWEVIEPDDPWSYIGYWGDHQIIYLLRLLVLSEAHHPGRLQTLLSERLFSYANVPYRIKPYQDLLRDPQDTVDFDAALEAEIERRVESIGADGKLVWTESGDVLLVSLAEKLLVPLLAKLSNFIPEGGIWMNTQRPEWNDANNALVGNGVSMVTLFAVRRYLTFLRDLLPEASGETAILSAEVAGLFDAVAAAFSEHAPLVQRALTDEERKTIVDALGIAGSDYREALYRDGLSGTMSAVPYSDIRSMIDDAMRFVDHTIEVNEREDGLYHAYNLMTSSSDAIHVSHLYAMLEGQVAALDSGVLSPEASLRVLRSLRASDIYRPDQHSYRLYPDRSLPGFLEKNTLSPEAVAGVPLFQELVDAGDTSLVVRDVRGDVHFNGAFRNKADVLAALDALSGTEHAPAAERDASGVLDAFEAVFDHRSYTGRSGTFFGYEGLGSIYWHMVSKLALAAQESFFRAQASGASDETLSALADAYYDIRAGLGVHKTPEEYGAFPTDAYSHTPGHAGAKQPGMTGQVKEDILCRWGELGVMVSDGQIAFRPALLRDAEFVSEPTPYDYIDLGGSPQSLDLGAGQLAFTYCQTPVIYTRSPSFALRIVRSDGSTETVDGDALSPEASAEVFGRTGSISHIEVDLSPTL